MIGAFIRIRRGDRFVNVDVDELTDAEIDETFTNRSPEELVRWLRLVIGFVRDNVRAEEP